MLTSFRFSIFSSATLLIFVSSHLSVLGAQAQSCGELFGVRGESATAAADRSTAQTMMAEMIEQTANAYRALAPLYSVPTPKAQARSVDAWLGQMQVEAEQQMARDAVLGRTYQRPQAMTPDEAALPFYAGATGYLPRSKPVSGVAQLLREAMLRRQGDVAASENLKRAIAALVKKRGTAEALSEEMARAIQSQPEVIAATYAVLSGLMARSGDAGVALSAKIPWQQLPHQPNWTNVRDLVSLWLALEVDPNPNPARVSVSIRGIPASRSGPAKSIIDQAAFTVLSDRYGSR